jgi:hypothetical protein
MFRQKPIVERLAHWRVEPWREPVDGSWSSPSTHTRAGAQSGLQRRLLSALAERARKALVLLAAGWSLIGCGHTADLLDAALMHPVLVEDFEAPVIADVSVYPAGQSLHTAAHRWDIAAGGIEVVNAAGYPDTAASDGHQAVHLTGSMTTAFPTIRKKQYTLTLHYAHHNRLGLQPGRARVEILGVGPTLLEADISHEGVAFDSYRRYTGTFTADSPQTTVRFTSLTPGAYGITLDGISVRSAYPAPETSITPGRRNVGTAPQNLG